MKLIIDIDEEIYKSVLDGSYCGSLYTELKNGTPYEEELPSYNLPSFDKLSRLGAGLPE